MLSGGNSWPRFQYFLHSVLQATDDDRSPEFAQITYQLEGSGSDR